MNLLQGNPRAAYQAGTLLIRLMVGAVFFTEEVRELSQYGFWSMAHEMRTDWAMLLGSLVLILAGGGPYSLDALLARRRSAASFR